MAEITPGDTFAMIACQDSCVGWTPAVVQWDRDVPKTDKDLLTEATEELATNMLARRQKSGDTGDCYTEPCGCMYMLDVAEPGIWYTELAEPCGADTPDNPDWRDFASEYGETWLVRLPTDEERIDTYPTLEAGFYFGQQQPADADAAECIRLAQDYGMYLDSDLIVAVEDAETNGWCEHPDNGQYLSDELMRAEQHLSEHCPPFHYASFDGDAGGFGVWLNVESVQEAWTELDQLAAEQRVRWTELVSTLSALVREGHTTREIAEIIGGSQTRVQQLLKDGSE